MPSLSARRRHLISSAIALVLLVTTAGTANACIATCASRVGTLFRQDGYWWELMSCVQTETMDGPVYITCTYRTYPAS